MQFWRYKGPSSSWRESSRLGGRQSDWRSELRAHIFLQAGSRESVIKMAGVFTLSKPTSRIYSNKTMPPKPGGTVPKCTRLWGTFTFKLQQ